MMTSALLVQVSRRVGYFYVRDLMNMYSIRVYDKGSFEIGNERSDDYKPLVVREFMKFIGSEGDYVQRIAIALENWIRANYVIRPPPARDVLFKLNEELNACTGYTLVDSENGFSRSLNSSGFTDIVYPKKVSLSFIYFGLFVTFRRLMGYRTNILDRYFLMQTNDGKYKVFKFNDLLDLNGNIRKLSRSLNCDSNLFINHELEIVDARTYKYNIYTNFQIEIDEV